MKRAMLFAAAAIFAASPARATGTIACRASDRADLSLSLVVGHLAGPSVVRVQLGDGRQTRYAGGDGAQLILLQSWIDEREIRADLADANGEAYVARLRTRRAGRDLYRGTLRYRDRVHRMSCREAG